jgi:hypothetical protein
VCGTAATISTILSTNASGSPGLDTRPPEMRRSTISSWVHECAACGCCAYDLADPPPGAADAVHSDTYQRLRRDEAVPELARRFSCAAHLHEAAQQHARAFWACLHAAWACDDRQAGDAAAVCRDRALECATRARTANQPLLAPAQAESLLVADVLRRTRRFDDARATLDAAAPPSTAFLDLFAFERDLIALEDAGVHTVAEAKPRPRTPPRIHLRRAIAVAWTDAARVTELARAMTDLGFEDAGIYTIQELPVARLQGFARRRDDLLGQITDHDRAGIWIEITTSYLDGRAVHASNQSNPRPIDSRPAITKLSMPDASPQAMCERVLAERPEGQIRPATPQGFVERFEQGWAEAMDWRNARGGMTEQEIRATAAQRGKPVRDAIVAKVRDATARHARGGLEEALAERFRERIAIDELDWQRLRPRLVFVHDQLPVDEVRAAFVRWVGEPAPWPVGLSARRAFEVMNQLLPEARRFAKFDVVVADPVAADVYRAAGM